MNGVPVISDAAVIFPDESKVRYFDALSAALTDRVVNVGSPSKLSVKVSENLSVRFLSVSNCCASKVALSNAVSSVVASNASLA